MKRFIATLVGALLCFPAFAEVWQARYGVAETFNFKLYNADGTLDVDEVDGGTEVSLSCNEGAETTATNDFVDEGTFYSIALTATEMQCERIAVVIAATTTEVFFIQTYGNASAMTPYVPANVEQYGGSAGTFASGRPEVNVSHIAGSAVSTSTAQIGVNVVNAGGTAWGSGAITAASIATDAIGAAEIAAGAIAEDAFDTTAGSFKPLGILDQGTAQAATATTVQLRSAAAFGDDTLLGATIVACGSTQGYCQSGVITDYVSSTDTATVATWGVTPSGTVTYYVFGTAPGSGSGASAADVWAYATRTLTALDEDSTTIDLNASAVGSVAGAVGSIGTGGITAASFGAGAIDAAAIAADAIGASEIATDAIGAAEIAASAIGSSEIADGGITSAEFGTDAITATVVAADAIGASELAADAATEVASATLTAAETTPIAADAQEINGVTVLGAGTTADKWRGP